MVTPAKRVNIVSLELVRESSLLYGPRQCTSVEAAYELVSPFIKNKDREHFLVLGLNTKNEPTVIHIAHIGTANQSIAVPRDILKPVLLSNGNRMIVSHNHPSGDTTPSKQDNDFTKRLQEAGKIIGIELIDHLIVSPNDIYYSFKEAEFI
ncbi:JAB domain-containing protein [uncultured Vagococcus sp.]|uniref:JAB domain-containing protein n=1 Tax=uncultured Vagococcus sp. TaxID=189676 RepID=UPI0025892502|nr:JAB domain-containing protein [uncultured Vagococcus sp.]